jgi:predicted lipoprotein with Yx(FWY)xxD motif
MNRTRAVVVAASAAFGLATVAACGGAATDTATSPPPSQTTQAPAGAAAGLKLTATTVGALGQVVTDAGGMTLYRFDSDTAKPPASNCEGTCATAWPPMMAASNTATLDGVDQSVVGTVARKDGSKQITISGWPVYRFAKDTAPGDAKGQGTDGKWYAVTPQGKKASGGPVSAAPGAGAPAPATSSAASGGGGGYGY